MTYTKPYIIGVSGRSGSGKSTLVTNINAHYGPEIITIHTMDNYYKDRENQLSDEKGYLNFDLPSSFERNLYFEHLLQLIKGEEVLLSKYNFNNKSNAEVISLRSAPVIFVEGLFIYFYEEVRKMINYSVMMDLSMNHCFKRRLKRDVLERNYKEEEVEHRYFQHVEPAFSKYIDPFTLQMDLLVNNTSSIEEGQQQLIEHIDNVLLQIH